MTNGLVQHITVEESTSIQSVRADLRCTVRLKSLYFSATKNNISGTKNNFSPTKNSFSATKIIFSPTKINFSPTKNTDF